MTTWKARERVEARSYSDLEEKKAFLTGYADGWYGYPMWSNNERKWYPNAYSAGYHEGVGDMT